MGTSKNNNNLDDGCPVKKTAGIIQPKWVILIIRELMYGKKRYSEIQKALVGISPKILTARLRFLEGAQILTRTVYPTVPLTTEYALTELGLKMEALLQAMAIFGSELEKVSKSNAKCTSR